LRDYDVLLYGAGGFTGRQTVAYFTSHAPAGLRWAIAGRRLDTLDAARRAAQAPLPDRDVLVAPSQDQAAVDRVVAQSRIVVSTAGPFARYGTPIVDACVRFGSHYVDITGETPWMRDIADRYHEPAAATGTRIIPACGFDSVPSDLGAWLMARHIHERFGQPAREVNAYFQFSGGLNGGTVASLINMLDMPRAARTPAPPRDGRIRLVSRPCHDAAIDAWIGPFVMALTNTHVVRRSLALMEAWGETKGPRTYQEAMLYRAPLGRIRATAATAGLGLLLASMKSPLTRRLVQPLLPKPGAGPSEERMDRGWFSCDLLGIADDGRRARGLIRYDGDPGNRATTVMLCESALALAIEAERLPGGLARGGVLTPVTGLGDVLVERLRRAGVIIDIPAADRRSPIVDQHKRLS
jgi:short subunit dehydrogenase-like uncharacterized protein